MGKFGIGARVRDEDGDEGVIVGKPGKGYRDIRYETGIAAGLVVPSVAKSLLTPIPANNDTPAPAEQGGFKVGDRVRFTDKCLTSWWFGPHTEHKIGAISHVMDDVIVVECDNGGAGYVSPHQIEPLPVAAEAQPVGDIQDDVKAMFDELEAWMGEDIPVAVAPATATPARKFRVGDRVRIVRNSRGDTWLERQIGACFTITAPGGWNGVEGWAGNENMYWWPEEDLELVDTSASADITTGSLVTLAAPAMVTGFDPHNTDFVHVVLGTGGAYTLPRAALQVA